MRTTLLALVAFSIIGLAHCEGEPELIAIPAPEWELFGENGLQLNLNLGNEESHSFELYLMKNLYSIHPYHAECTYRHFGDNGWVVATINHQNKQVEGVYFDASSKKAIQFGHVSKFTADTAEKQRFLSGTEYVAGDMDVGEFCDTDNLPSIPDLGSSEDEEDEASRGLTSDARQLNSDPLVFYGGGQCFTGDQSARALSIGIVTDKAYFEKEGNSVRSSVENIVAIASSAYEYQFNVALRIGDFMRYESYRSNVPHSIFSTCPEDIPSALNTFSSYVASMPSSKQQAHWHFISNCFTEKTGVRGVAFVGTAGCRYSGSGWNTGVSQTSATLWKTFAHEVGHGVGMAHTTDGIMRSTGKGLIDNKPRFSLPGKDQACPVFQRMVSGNCRFFTSLGPTPKPTPYPTGFPTKYPSKRPTPSPTKRPTKAPTMRPTRRPTRSPTSRPTKRPTPAPTSRPTKAPTMRPTRRPTRSPTSRPTKRPTPAPTSRPTKAPTMRPTRRPTKTPTERPTRRSQRGEEQPPIDTPTCAKMSHVSAEETCEERGMVLCSVDALEAAAPLSECQNDRKWVWTSNSCSSSNDRMLIFRKRGNRSKCRKSSQRYFVRCCPQP